MDNDIEQLNRSFDDFVLESDDEDKDVDEEVNLSDYLSNGDDSDEDEQQPLVQGWNDNVIKPIRPDFVEGETLVSMELENCTKPLDYFNLFFTEEMVQLIVEESNRYGNQKYRNFDIIAPEEIDVIVAMFLKMGYIPLPKLDDYWSTDSALTGNKIFEGITDRNKQ